LQFNCQLLKAELLYLSQLVKIIKLTVKLVHLWYWLLKHSGSMPTRVINNARILKDQSACHFTLSAGLSGSHNFFIHYGQVYQLQSGASDLLYFWVALILGHWGTTITTCENSSDCNRQHVILTATSTRVLHPNKANYSNLWLKSIDMVLAAIATIPNIIYFLWIELIQSTLAWVFRITTFLLLMLRAIRNLHYESMKNDSIEQREG